MNTKTTLTLAAALIAVPAIKAQQNPQPQLQTTASAKQAPPCAPASPTETRAKNRIFGKIAGEIDAHAWQIAKGTHGMVDNNDAKGVAGDAVSTATKPCVQKQAANINPPATPTPSAPVPVPESRPVISEDWKHVYICPGPSHKNAELPICELPDGRYLPMQEIPIPPGSLIKGGPANNGASAGSASPGVNTQTVPQSATPATSQAAQTSGAHHN